MGFITKRELLEHIGKNPKDNKLVDRMMRRGEVYMEDGMYYIVESEEVIKLKERIKELEKSESKPQVIVQEWDTAKLKKELVEARNDLTFQIGEYERLQHKMEKALAKCYDLMVEKKVVVKERNPLSSFIRWATDVDMSDMDEDMPF